MGTKRKFIVISVRDDRKPKYAICAMEWTKLRSRVDFMLERFHPDFMADLMCWGKKIEDTKCPRQEKPVRAEDMI